MNINRSRFADNPVPMEKIAFLNGLLQDPNVNAAWLEFQGLPQGLKESDTKQIHARKRAFENYTKVRDQYLGFV